MWLLVLWSLPLGLFWPPFKWCALAKAAKLCNIVVRFHEVVCFLAVGRGRQIVAFGRARQICANLGPRIHVRMNRITLVFWPVHKSQSILERQTRLQTTQRASSLAANSHYVVQLATRFIGNICSVRLQHTKTIPSSLSSALHITQQTRSNSMGVSWRDREKRVAT